MDTLNQKYEAFRADVVARGLQRRRYVFYGIYVFFIVYGIAVSLYLITLSSNPFLQIANSIFLTLLLTQAGMLGHDFSHGQVFVSQKLNRFFGMLMWGLFGGLSESAWYDQHNIHHKHVNQIQHDPDIDIPFLFRDNQHLGRYSLSARLVTYQHVLFFVSMPFWYMSKLVTSWKKAFIYFSWRLVIEASLSVIHFCVLFYLVFAYLPWWLAITFLVVHVCVGGAYLSSAFAPNHKGEEVLSAEQKVTWKNQITSTRNLRPGFFTFYFFGGLNFQVEHHLFSDMPRINYWKVHPLVKQFCAENAIPYHETTWFGSQKEIYASLKREASRTEA